MALHASRPMPLAICCSSSMLCVRKIRTELSLGSHGHLAGAAMTGATASGRQHTPTSCSGQEASIPHPRAATGRVAKTTVASNPIGGVLLDRPVISSRPIGYVGEHMQFETISSPLGELVYQLKYRNGPVNTLSKQPLPSSTGRWNGLPTGQFRTIKSFEDLKDLLAQGDSDSVERIVSELHLNVA